MLNRTIPLALFRILGYDYSIDQRIYRMCCVEYDLCVINETNMECNG